MLSLDGLAQSARRRPPWDRKHGQHARNSDDQACVDAFAAFLRADASGAGRCLGRMARKVLASRLLPAAVALAEATGTVLARQAPDCPAEPINFTVSPACLIGRCRAWPDGPGCDSLGCEHDCHSEVRHAAAWQAGAPAA
jgi:hypothetical protein